MGHDRRGIRSKFAATVAAMVMLLMAIGAHAGLTTGSETVEGDRASGVFGWHFKYKRSFDGKKMEKDVQIDFDFTDSGIKAEDQKAYRDKVRAGIQKVWNNKYVIRSGDLVIPLGVDVTYDGPFDQKVKVNAGSGRSDMTNWFTDDTGSVNAHEFGHMLGLFDEYTGGATDPANPIIDDKALMGLGALTDNPAMPARYYQQFLDYIRSLNRDTQFELKAVPEPASLLVWGVLLGVCLGVRSVRLRMVRREP